MADAGRRPLTPSDSPYSEPKPERRSVLLVDDDESVLITAAALLEDEYTVHAVSSGEAAVQFLSQTRVDLVCADLRMPGMDGMELLAYVGRRYPETSGVLVTGHRDLLVGKDAQQLAGYTVLLKPYSVEELFASIERAIRRNQLTRPNPVLRGS